MNRASKVPAAACRRPQAGPGWLAARRWAETAAGLLVVALPQAAQACAVCFGQPDSPLSRGLSWGVLSLLAVVLGVLGGVAAFAVVVARRASQLAALARSERLDALAPEEN